MADRGILFSESMVRAILAGTKWQTRRVARPQPSSRSALGPYVAGDILWVRETYAELPDGRIVYRADGGTPATAWRPSIHMPRRLSRLTLEVLGVTIQRLQCITASDAIAEGVSSCDEFRRLWDDLYAARGRGWQSNPSVWVLEFRAVEISQTR